MKRLISANTSDLLQMTPAELKQSIQASEGRTIMSETVTMISPLMYDITNAEVARAFGADLILLNGFDVNDCLVGGLSYGGIEKENVIKELKRLVGRPIGVNLEPVDTEANMLEDRLDISAGRQATVESMKKAEQLGFQFICLTGNPGTGVTNEKIADAIKLAKENFSGLVIAGKMHGAGLGKTVDIEAIQSFIEADADIILAPAVGTVPGFDDEDMKQICKLAHDADKLVLSAIGTSQESSDEETIRQIAIRNKVCGVDIQHIGDAGFSGIALVENIYALSVAIRGRRHTISMISRSINR